MTEISILLLMYFTHIILAGNAEETAEMLSLQMGRILQDLNEQQCPPPKTQGRPIIQATPMMVTSTMQEAAERLSSLKDPIWHDITEEQSPPEAELKEDNTWLYSGLAFFQIALAATLSFLNYKYCLGLTKDILASQDDLLKQQEQQRQLQLKQQERTVQRNDTLALTTLNKITTHFNDDTLWRKGECVGEYHLRASDETFLLKGESKCQLPFALLQSVLLLSLQEHLNVSCILANSILTCRVDLQSNEQVELLQNDSRLFALRLEILQALQSDTAYQEYKYQNTLAQTFKAQTHFRDVLEQAHSRYQTAKSGLDLLQNESKALEQSGILELNTKNARSQKQFDKVVRLISAYENDMLSVLLKKITAHKENNDLNQAIEQHIHNQAQCEQLLQRLLEAVRDLERNGSELAASLTTIRNELDMLIQGLTQKKPQPQKTVDSNNPLYNLQEKQRQRELLEAQQAQERERIRQEAEQKKAEFQRQQAIEKQRKLEQQEALARKKAYQLRLFAEQKALKEAQHAASIPTTSASSSAVSSVQLREKVVNLGDLALRFGQIQQPTVLQIMEYKYAMLSQCLRLFELTHRFCQTDLARRVRNALMHRHRYIVMESLYPFVNAIAHQPGHIASSHALKLEDLLIQLPSTPSEEHLLALNRVLDGLKETEFCVALLRVEREEATSKQQLESIQGLLGDLSQIKTKGELSLAVFPDKVLAVKGILLCIGECYQQLIHLAEHKELIQSPQWRSILLGAKALRDNLGHSATESPDDIQRFQDFIRRASDLANQLNAPLEDASHGENTSSFLP